jgi:hypothetical protein
MDEGYCGACQRLEPLDGKGFIAQHLVSYAEFGKWHRVTCKGTGELPGEVPEDGES